MIREFLWDMVTPLVLLYFHVQRNFKISLLPTLIVMVGLQDKDSGVSSRVSNPAVFKHHPSRNNVKADPLG